MSARLKLLIEHEAFRACPLLETSEFLQFCKDRDFEISSERLELLEQNGLFFPIARVDRSAERAGSSLSLWSREKSAIEQILLEGNLWDPKEKPNDADSNFADAYYSQFQICNLWRLAPLFNVSVDSLAWRSRSQEQWLSLANQIRDLADQIQSIASTPSCQEDDALLCQLISSRYYPHTQGDRRTINIPFTSPFNKWDWSEYCQQWKPKLILEQLTKDLGDIAELQKYLAIIGRDLDPMGNWYELIQFVQLSQKKKLKGKALFAQTIYSMEHMLRLFNRDLGGESLFAPDERTESHRQRKEELYGKNVLENDLQYLWYLTNQYGLNPQPSLVLFVEGDSEFQNLPWLIEEVLNVPLGRLGIEIRNLKGIANFTGAKRDDRYSALEKLIDYHHTRQTFVFLILDNEGRANDVRKKLEKRPSLFNPDRAVTKIEYIHIWGKNIEFDNFTNEEIASALTTLSEDRYHFTPCEIMQCRDNGPTNSLEQLFQTRLQYGMDKIAALKILFKILVEKQPSEVGNSEGIERPILNVIQKLAELVSINHPATLPEVWEKNQQSGYLG